MQQWQKNLLVIGVTAAALTTVYFGPMALNFINGKEWYVQWLILSAIALGLACVLHVAAFFLDSDYGFMKINQYFWTGIKFVLAFMTLSETYSLLADVLRTTTHFDDHPPADRCVPFFDKTKDLDAKYPKQSTYLYDYRSGDEMLRVCTDVGLSDAKHVFGESTFYDQVSTVTGCDISSQLADVKKNCIANEDTPDIDCAAAFETKPMPYGYQWLYSISGRSDDASQGLKCPTRVRRMTEITQPCPKSNVFAFHEEKGQIKIFFIVCSAIATVRLITELVYVVKYHQAGDGDKDASWLSLPDSGCMGSLYKLYLFIGGKGEDGCSCTRLDALPEVPELGNKDFLFMLGLDAMLSIAQPVVSVLGCSITSMPTKRMIIFFGTIVKEFGMITMDLKTRFFSGGKGDDGSQLTSLNTQLNETAIE